MVTKKPRRKGAPPRHGASTTKSGNCAADSAADETSSSAVAESRRNRSQPIVASSLNPNLNPERIARILAKTNAPKTKPALTPTDGPKDAVYEERVVAFVDILGFKEIIVRSARDENLVRRIHSALDLRHDNFAAVFAAEVGLQMAPKDFDDLFHTFSDCIVISVRPKIGSSCGQATPLQEKCPTCQGIQSCAHEKRT